MSSVTLILANLHGRFAEAVLKAVKGEKGIVEPSFVYLPGISGGDIVAKEAGIDFFSTPIELGVSILHCFFFFFLFLSVVYAR